MNTSSLDALCQQYQGLLLREDAHTISIAVVAPPSSALLEALRFASNKKIDISCWPEERLEKARQMMSEETLPSDQGQPVDLEALLDMALSRRASDIHFEPGEDAFRVRLRIDGVLYPLTPLSSSHAAPLLARIKVAADLDIAERRLPQDGQFTTRRGGKNIAFRVSTLPGRYGEKAVLRLQESRSLPLNAAIPGMSSAAQTLWHQALTSPQGLILVTGPTGSGKTRTLYAGLQQLNHVGVNICSVEDPIEIPLTGITQTQINNKAGLDFPRILRALLRQDPDIIMIGEIRDGITADIAIKAAQTGHLVLSTLHTNSTCETLIRLQQMGIPGWMVASSLRLIVAQRLVRKLCPHCRQPQQDSDPLPHEGVPEPLQHRHWLAVGCEHCYSGYYGRIALFELLTPGPGIRQAIVQGESAATLDRLARQQGMITLADSGMDAVTQGLTTRAELWRVLGETEDPIGDAASAIAGIESEGS